LFKLLRPLRQRLTNHAAFYIGAGCAPVCSVFCDTWGLCADPTSDSIEPDGTMKLCEDLDVTPENVCSAPPPRCRYFRTRPKLIALVCHRLVLSSARAMLYF